MTRGAGRPCRAARRRRAVPHLAAFRPARPAGRRRGKAPSARGTSRSMPGAVPCGLGTMRLPSGNMACSSFCWRHRPLAPGEKAADVLQGFRHEHQRPIGRRGQGLAGQIVGRGAQPAGGHDDVGPLDRPAKDVGRTAAISSPTVE